MADNHDHLGGGGFGESHDGGGVHVQQAGFDEHGNLAQGGAGGGPRFLGAGGRRDQRDVGTDPHGGEAAARRRCIQRAPASQLSLDVGAAAGWLGLTVPQEDQRPHAAVIGRPVSAANHALTLTLRRLFTRLRDDAEERACARPWFQRTSLAMAGFSLSRLLRRFKGDRKGAIAPIFALVAVPLILAAGVGIDVSRVVSSRNNLQDALDAAALALGRMPSSTPLATLKQQAQYWVSANLADKNIGTVTVNVAVANGVIDVSGTSTIPTAVVGLMGVQTLPVAGHSTVQYNLSHIELALVLDNTGSMADDNKLTSLQSAASSLVDTLSTSATNSNDPNALKIGVVPFSMTVNVGSTYKNASWLTGIAPAGYNDVNTAAQNRFSLFTKLGVSWGGCVEDRPMPYDVQDTAPTVANPNTMFVPFFAPDEPDTATYNYYSNNYYIYGNYQNGAQYYSVNSYISDGSTSNNYATREAYLTKYLTASGVSGANNAYWGDKAGPNSGCRTASLQRLTTDMTAVKTKLGQMIAAGDTEIPLGLMWGWHLLTPNAPFADGAAYGTTGVVKIAVLVTDGANTYGSSINPNLSYYTALGYASQQRITSAGTASATADALDDRLTQLCTNMKSAGVVIYTVPVEVTDTGIKSLLQSCASSSDKYIDVSNSSGLSAAFANIAGSISALRISK